MYVAIQQYYICVNFQPFADYKYVKRHMVKSYFNEYDQLSSLSSLHNSMKLVIRVQRQARTICVPFMLKKTRERHKSTSPLRSV